MADLISYSHNDLYMQRKYNWLLFFFYTELDFPPNLGEQGGKLTNFLI